MGIRQNREQRPDTTGTEQNLDPQKATSSPNHTQTQGDTNSKTIKSQFIKRRLEPTNLDIEDKFRTRQNDAKHELKKCIYYFINLCLRIISKEIGKHVIHSLPQKTEQNTSPAVSLYVFPFDDKMQSNIAKDFSHLTAKMQSNIAKDLSTED